MITDKQLQEHLWQDPDEQSLDSIEAGEYICDIDAIRELIEEYEQSKWVKFDIDDNSTWPSDGQTVITVTSWDEYKAFTFYKDDGYSSFSNGDYEVTAVKYWQPLPVFREIEE